MLVERHTKNKTKKNFCLVFVLEMWSMSPCFGNEETGPETFQPC